MAATLADRLASEPFHLRLSSGYFGFFAHAGFCRALEDRSLRPQTLGGSSAGAIIASFWAAGVPPSEMEGVLQTVRREDFWDPGLGYGLLKGDRFGALLDALLPSSTLEECEIPLSLSVFDVRKRVARVFDAGPLVDLVRASAALPGLFHPVWIAGRPYLDGGITDRPGLAGAPTDDAAMLHHHLPSSSPWKGVHERAVRSRHGTSASERITVELPGLPRLGPFKLAGGPAVYEEARERTARLLDRPTSSNSLAAAEPQIIA